MKKVLSVTRLGRAVWASVQGLRISFLTEAAFAQEVIAAAVLIPLALYLDLSVLHKVFLIVTVLQVLVVELINTAIESVVDRVSMEKHPLSKKAKDAGSAAVMMSLLIAAIVWAGVLVWDI